MRDIRADLKERLAGLQERRDTAKASYDRDMKAIADEELLVKGLLAVEERRLGIKEESPAPKRMPLDEFFVMQMKRQPKTKEDLREMAQQEGYFTGIESPRRVIHATLMNILRAGRIREIAGGFIAADSPVQY